MKKTTRVTALLLVLIMLMQTIPFAAQVGDFTDFPISSWSTEAMTAAVDNGLLIGVGNNKIEPKRNLTRAEMAAIITRAFGATVEKDISSFSDVKDSDWYHSVVAKAYNMQVMQGTSETTFSPKDSITRQEVFLALARVLHIDSSDYSILDKFSDKAKVAEWSKNAVTGMVGVDYLRGYNDGTLRPTGKITREELAQVFHNIFKTYISAPGHYTSVAPKGSVIIRAPGVILENVTINGDLVLADGIGAGDCTLYNVHVNGRIIVRGGEGTVDFVNVTSTGKVIVNDVNGTVNFHNYRTDVPFADNLLELTPATFLQVQPSGTGTGRPGGTGGGGTTTYAIDFFGLDGKSILDKPLKIKNNSTIALSQEEVPVFTVPGEYSGYSFYGWINSKTTNPEDVLNNPKLLMSESDVANAKVTGKVNYNAVIIDNDTGLLLGGPFGDGSSNYHAKPSTGTVTKDALMYHYDTEYKYPTKWKVTSIDGNGNTVTEELSIDELVEKLNNLDDDDIVVVEVIETADKIKLTFKDNVTGTETPVYAIPGYPLEADSIPQLSNVTKEGYFYEAKGWTLTEGSDTLVDFANQTFNAATNVFAKYDVSAIKIIVKYFHDADKNGVYDETPVSDTNGDGVVDEYDIAPEQYYTDNFDKPTHNLLESELPQNPSYEGIDNGTLDEKFVGWAESKADADAGNVITYPYAMTEANNPYKLYASFTSDFSTVTFVAVGGNTETTVKVGNNTGKIIEGTIPTFTPADEEKQYFFGWKNKDTNDEIAADDFEDYIKDYIKTNKQNVSFEAIFKDKTVITFYEEDGTTVYKTQYIIPDGVNKATEEAYPAIADEEKQYVDGWTTDGTTAFNFDTVIGKDNIDLYPLIKDKTAVTFYEFGMLNVFKVGDEEQIYYYKPDETVTKPASDPALLAEHVEEYYFFGWSTEKNQVDLDENKLFKFGEKAGENDIKLYPVRNLRYPVVFVYTDVNNIPDTISPTKYAIPRAVLETDRIPMVPGYNYNGYEYTFEYWTEDAVNNGGFEAEDTNNDGVIDEKDNLVGAGAKVDLSVTTINVPNKTFYAVYRKAPLENVVKFIYDKNKDGTLDDTATTDTNGDGVIDEYDTYTEQYNEQSVNTGDCIIVPENPKLDADNENTYTFRYWTLEKAKAGAFLADENGNLIGDVGAEFDFTVPVDGSTPLIKLYAVFEKTPVPYTVTYTVDYAGDFREIEEDENGTTKIVEWTDNEDETVYNGVVTLPAAGSVGVPVRNGTTFKYWYTKNADDTITPVTTSTITVTKDITLYAYMECAVNFIDSVDDDLGPRNATIYVQYNTPIDGEKEYAAGVYNKDILAWTRVEKGFERNASVADEYATLNYVHEIAHTWFEKDLQGKWVETAAGSGEWIWTELSADAAKLVDFDKTAKITTDTNVYLTSRRINANAFIERFPDFEIKATVPYEIDEENPEEGRFLTAVKDAIFMNEGFITEAYEVSDVEDKLFDKLRKYGFMANNSKEILNIDKTIEFAKVIGEENLAKLIDKYLSNYFQGDAAAESINEFLTKYLTNVNESNEKEVAEQLGKLVNGMLDNNKDDTILTLEKAAHNIAENDLTALSDVIKQYVRQSLTDETDADNNGIPDREEELRNLLNEAFIRYCKDHEADFHDFLETIIKDLLIYHPNPEMIDMVTKLAIEKVKAGEFKSEITTEIEKLSNEELSAIIVEFVENDFSFVESGIITALDDENFVISMVELLADDPTFKATIKSLAQETLNQGGDDLKNKLKEMFLNDLTPEQQENLIDTYVTNLNDPAKIRQLALDHIAEISNEQILGYIQGDNPLIVLSASDLLGYIKDYQNQIPDATILAKIKEENSPIKVPSDKLLALVKDGTISIPENTVLSLVKTELKGLDNATIASYIKDGTIPVEDSFIESIIISEIEAQRDSLVADAIQDAKDSGDYDAAVQAYILSEGLSEEEAKAKVEKKIADEVDLEIDNTIVQETTPDKIAEAKANITEEQVNTYRSDINAKVDALTYASIEAYAENYIQNKLTATDIDNNYATLVAQLDKTTFASMKESVISALDEATVVANKTAFLSLVTAEVVGNVKTEVITKASNEDILKIKESIAGILKNDGTIRETVINNYLDEAFTSDDLGDNLDELLADPTGRHLIAVVVADYINSDAGIAAGAKKKLVDEVITTLKSDINSNDSKMLTKAINAYISDAARKAELITKAINMLSTPDVNGDYVLDNTSGSVYELVYDTVYGVITDENKCDETIKAYVDSVIQVEDGQEIDFTEIIDIFCAGDNEKDHIFRDGVIDRFIVNLEKLPDKDEDGVGDGVEIVEEMIDAILEKMGNAGHVDEEIILVVLDYIVKHHEDEHGQELVQELVKTILSMDNILEFVKDLGYDAVDETLAEVDKFKKQITTEEQFEVTSGNKIIIDELYKLALTLDFDSLVDKYIKPRLPEKAFNELPLDIARPIYERSHKDYLGQLEAAIAKAENGEVGYVNSGVTINFNPIHEIYVPIYEYALEEYEKACGFVDDNTGRPGDAYDKYVKENPYIDDLINLMNPEKLFTELRTDHDYTNVGSGYAVKEFADYYGLVKSAAVLLDDTFLWYLDKVDFEDIENVLREHEERVLHYTNLLISLANAYATEGIPDDIEDIYNDILADALASGDFEKIVGKVENITNKDVEYYIDRVLENRYPELAYDKALSKVGARVATILDLYIDSKFNRFVDGEDYDKVVELLEFAYEDQNANITVDYVFDKIMDEDNTKNVEFRGNTAEISRTVSATMSD